MTKPGFHAPDGASVPIAPISGPDDAERVLRAFLPQDREGFAILMLDARSRCFAAQVVSVGSLTVSIVHPREVFKTAILANAHALILGHNHPSGCLEPSAEDLDITQRVVSAGKVLGIPVVDHVIVTPASGAHSLRGDARHAPDCGWTP